MLSFSSNIFRFVVVVLKKYLFHSLDYSLASGIPSKVSKSVVFRDISLLLSRGTHVRI